MQDQSGSIASYQPGGINQMVQKPVRGHRSWRWSLDGGVRVRMIRSLAYLATHGEDISSSSQQREGGGSYEESPNMRRESKMHSNQSINFFQNGGFTWVNLPLNHFPKTLIDCMNDAW